LRSLSERSRVAEATDLIAPTILTNDDGLMRVRTPTPRWSD
jgi:hypothetical protein